MALPHRRDCKHLIFTKLTQSIGHMTAQVESHHSDIWMWHFKMAAILNFHKFDLLTYFQFWGYIIFDEMTNVMSSML